MFISKCLAEYIRACFTGLWIESHEHEHALTEIAQLCRDEDWQIGEIEVMTKLVAVESLELLLLELINVEPHDETRRGWTNFGNFGPPTHVGVHDRCEFRTLLRYSGCIARLGDEDFVNCSGRACKQTPPQP